MTVRTRFAPSPTGLLHVGGVRTALFCWLYARRHGGEFVLRIEDTDRERSTQASVDAIVHSLDWLGIDADVGPVYQSERLARYKEAVTQLLDEGKAYRCYCSTEELDAMREQQRADGLKPRYNRRCRDGRDAPDGVEPVIRFKTPLDGEVSFDDHVRGNITVSNEELDDLVICRGDGMPTYNFAVVVDDADMQITHVVRGDDHVNNTPRQINIFSALSFPVPQFAHVPMILGDDGARLSKRHGAVGVMEYREAGYLPEALLNYLVRLGWSHGDQEIFSRDEMIKYFDLTDVNKAASTFNREKLDWLNQQYLKSIELPRVVELYKEMAQSLGYSLATQPEVEQVCDLWRERVCTVQELVQSTRFAYETPVADTNAASKYFTTESAPLLEDFSQRLKAIGHWTAEEIKSALQSTVDECGVKFGKVAAPVRLAITGAMGGADLDRSIELVGREQALSRLTSAIVSGR